MRHQSFLHALAHLEHIDINQVLHVSDNGHGQSILSVRRFVETYKILKFGMLPCKTPQQTAL